MITNMVEFKIKQKKLAFGKRAGQTVYFATPKAQIHMTNKELVEQIVRETSLSAGDVINALISLSNVVCEVLRMGGSVDLAELGLLRASFSSRMMDSPEEVTVRESLATPRIHFTPKAPMRNALKEVEMVIDHGRVESSNGD